MRPSRPQTAQSRPVETRLRHARDFLTCVDGTLALFDPSAVPAKKPYGRVKLFGHGKLNALILDALRRGARRTTTREVRDAIIADGGFGPDAAKGMDSRVRANLLYLWKVRGPSRRKGAGRGDVVALESRLKLGMVADDRNLGRLPMPMVLIRLEDQATK